MATLVHNRSTHERQFTVPINGRLAASPFASGTAAIAIETDAQGRPTAVRLRFRPNVVEFQLKLNKLVKAGRLQTPAHVFSRQAGHKQPVVDYRADAALMAGLPGGLDDMLMLEALFMAHSEALFDLKRYRLEGIAFEA